MKNNESQLSNSGLLLGSEPLEDVRQWRASAQADDDKSDTRDTDGTDAGDTDATDGKETDGSDTDGTDGKD